METSKAEEEKRELHKQKLAEAMKVEDEQNRPDDQKKVEPQTKTAELAVTEVAHVPEAELDTGKGRGGAECGRPEINGAIQDANSVVEQVNETQTKPEGSLTRKQRRKERKNATNQQQMMQ